MGEQSRGEREGERKEGKRQFQSLLLRKKKVVSEPFLGNIYKNLTTDKFDTWYQPR